MIKACKNSERDIRETGCCFVKDGYKSVQIVYKIITRVGEVNRRAPLLPSVKLGVKMGKCFCMSWDFTEEFTAAGGV